MSNRDDAQSNNNNSNQQQQKETKNWGRALQLGELN
jgi:hypothetical protein